MNIFEILKKLFTKKTSKWILNVDDKTSIIMPAFTHSINQVTDLKMGALLNTGENGEFSNFPGQINLSVKTSF